MSTDSPAMLFCVFSYNRGQFLENCVHSIERCIAQARIVVFDDNSTDTSTVAALDRIATRHRVIRSGPPSKHRLGGLYGNMQTALELNHAEDLLCFLQDDMQVVRSVTSSDIEGVERAFRQCQDLAFIQPCFLKGCNRARDASSLSFDTTRALYFRSETGQRAGRHFSAVSIMKPSRLCARDWTFERSEPLNDAQAERLFGRLGHMFAPFAMYLPEVPAYRGQRKTWALRYAEHHRRCGFYPFKALTGPQADALLTRSPDVLPVAEEFLECAGTTPAPPWRYYPLQGSRTLRRLNDLELLLRRLP
jgi:glycosyltransferase involved in cell wall biosynthesis